jgi:hypothetical protein
LRVRPSLRTGRRSFMKCTSISKMVSVSVPGASSAVGTSAKHGARQRAHPDFPLRGFVRCNRESCVDAALRHRHADWPGARAEPARDVGLCAPCEVGCEPGFTSRQLERPTVATEADAAALCSQRSVRGCVDIVSLLALRATVNILLGQQAGRWWQLRTSLANSFRAGRPTFCGGEYFFVCRQRRRPLD